MIKFPSIGQFREVVKEVRLNHDFAGKDLDGNAIYKHSSNYPKITFEGTVKLHGTNAGIIKYKDRIEFQSRERVLSLQQDNCNFMLNMLNKNIDVLFKDIEFNEHIAIFGEWCGQGIQKGVAVSELPKMFVIFAVKIDGVWSDIIVHNNLESIYHIKQFTTFNIDIDFDNPELSQNKLIEITNCVEQNCPVGEFFGVRGIGEGVVWSGKHKDKFYIFKVKGEKHSVTKVKVLASVDIESIENIKEFVDSVVTENRLQQGICFLNENNKSLDQKSTGDFLRWIVNDVIKEESDTIVKNQFDVKKINSSISNKARVWFFDYLDKLVIG